MKSMTLKYIDPTFDLPPDVEGWAYKEYVDVDNSGIEYVEDYDPVDDEGNTSDEEVTGGVALGEDPLLPPENMSVIEYVTRIDADGNTVVDAVVDVDGAPGTLQYDVRLAKR